MTTRRIVRTCVSYITREQCEKFREDSNSIRPTNTPICENLNTFEVIAIGNQIMEEKGFVLSRGIDNV